MILRGTGRGTMRSMVEGGRDLLTAPSTTPLRVAVPLPVPGRIYESAARITRA
jgi:hypothetical protein